MSANVPPNAKMDSQIISIYHQNSSKLAGCKFVTLCCCPWAHTILFWTGPSNEEEKQYEERRLSRSQLDPES